MSPGSLITTIAGTGIAGFTGDDMPASLSMLSQPFGVAVDKSGHNVYICDTMNQRIRRLAYNQV